jgi:hypothetical protein
MSAPYVVVRDVLSSASAAVNSEPVRVAGQGFSFQTVSPGAFAAIQISNDGQTWVVSTNIENSDNGSTLQSTHDEVKERPEWARLTIATDASGPRLYRCYFHIRKDNS